ncbi:MAG TPA: succinate dehydrogenase, cytochrome b556 subunit [Longimicrobium sp.]|nr:succinate dehydrogenase, cytochrome b556 subunit [Longimicrobium sp.]
MASDFRARSLGHALRYKGNAGMWTWLLHRVTGLGILAFLIIHVIDTAVVVYWPDFYDHTLDIYRSPLFRVAELLIFFAVLYHALNGLRIIIQDFWPIAMMHQRRMAWAVSAITAVLILPVAWIMLAPLFGLRPEPGTERHERRMRERGAVERVYLPTGPETGVVVEAGATMGTEGGR